jgi:hypothetical protein
VGFFPRDPSSLGALKAIKDSLTIMISFWSAFPRFLPEKGFISPIALCISYLVTFFLVNIFIRGSLKKILPRFGEVFHFWSLPLHYWVGQDQENGRVGNCHFIHQLRRLPSYFSRFLLSTYAEASPFYTVPKIAELFQQIVDFLVTLLFT